MSINVLTSHRLESTAVSQEAKDRLAEIVESLKADRENLDVNYDHHAQVNETRNKKKYVAQ